MLYEFTGTRAFSRAAPRPAVRAPASASQCCYSGIFRWSSRACLLRVWASRLAPLASPAGVHARLYLQPLYACTSRGLRELHAGTSRGLRVAYLKRNQRGRTRASRVPLARGIYASLHILPLHLPLRPRLPPLHGPGLLLVGGSRFSLAPHAIPSLRYVAPHYLQLLMAYKHTGVPYNPPSLWLPRPPPMAPGLSTGPDLRRIDLYATAPVDATSGKAPSGCLLVRVRAAPAPAHGRATLNLQGLSPPFGLLRPATHPMSLACAIQSC
ncbi:hypothetical protein FB451DRAFT_1412074 [Mycena latifolia]|nr:hypothetical protein FB451DRAFT_1412074 [Mycena latifolia]